MEMPEVTSPKKKKKKKRMRMMKKASPKVRTSHLVLFLGFHIRTS
jgi:hypothetical protein